MLETTPLTRNWSGEWRSPETVERNKAGVTWVHHVVAYDRKKFCIDAGRSFTASCFCLLIGRVECHQRDPQTLGICDVFGRGELSIDPQTVNDLIVRILGRGAIGSLVESIGVFGVHQSMSIRGGRKCRVLRQVLE